jgi:hypothetical protein
VGSSASGVSSDDAEVVADLDRLQAALDRLEEHWRRVNAPVLEFAGPGLSEEQIIELSNEAGLHLPEEARHWFAWRNGTGVQNPRQAAMGPRFYLPSLEDQLKQYRWHCSFAAEMVSKRGLDRATQIWSPLWFPMIPCVFGMNAVSMDTDIDEGLAAPVGYSDKDFDDFDRPGQGRTLTGLVEFWVDCHDRGLYQWQPHKRDWHADPDGSAPGPWSSFYF